MKLTLRNKTWDVIAQAGMTARDAVRATGLRLGVDVHAWRKGKILRPDARVEPDDEIQLTTILHGG
mgnify:CR=1 FL=1